MCRTRIDGPGPQGVELKRALESCLAFALRQRREEETRHGFHQYVHFLNHELRTPLTAATTSLQILTRELADQGGDSLLEFAEIAARNLQRLNRTVVWSDGYLASQCSRSKPELRELPLAELIDRAAGAEVSAGELSFQVSPRAAETSLVCDPDLLATLLQQVRHAIAYQAPKASLVVEVGFAGAEDAEQAAVVFSFQVPESQVGGRTGGHVVRTGLVSRRESPRDEFGRLVEFTVSREILSQLGATIATSADGSAATPVVTLTLPVAGVHRAAAIHE